MAIIHADGLSHGDRLKRCSDMAQLYWPFFYVASNTCARLEINYPKLIATIFANLKEPPSEEDFFSYLGEYQDVYLLFVYQVEGRIWGQWDTPEDNLLKYKLKADRNTPEPPAEEFQRWRAEYQKQKAQNGAKSFNLRTFVIPSNNSEKFPKVSHGVGGGDGVVEDRKDKPKSKPSATRPDSDPRHGATRDYIKRVCEFKKVPFMWSGAEGKALSDWLQAAGKISQPEIEQLVKNRFRSKDPPGQRPRVWIPQLSSYTTPLNEFNKPEQVNGTSKAQQRNIGNLQNIAQGFGVDSDVDTGGRELEDHSDSSDGRTLEGNTKPV